MDLPLLTRAAAVADRGAARLRAALASPVRTPRVVVVLGRVLGPAYLICFLTGLYSHLLQHPPDWLVFPTQPANLFQITQGLHVTTGTMLLPLLVAKLWAVYPLLFEWPPVRSPLHALERGSIAALVAVAIVEPVIGLINSAQWYPFGFPFIETHYLLAWLLIGLIALHLAIKLPTIVRHGRREGPDER